MFKQDFAKSKKKIFLETKREGFLLAQYKMG